MKLTKKDIEDDYEFLDAAAIAIMSKNIKIGALNNFGEAIKIARYAYINALALLTVKKFHTDNICEMNNIIKKE